MKTARFNYAFVSLVCLLVSGVAYASWDRVNETGDGDHAHTVGPEPEQGSWESDANSNHWLGGGLSWVDTKAFDDGAWWEYLNYYPYSIRHDVQTATSGLGWGWGSYTMGYEWQGASPPDPACDLFYVCREVTLRCTAVGDADNGAISTGTVELQGDADGHVNINVGGVSQGVDVNWEIYVLYNEWGDWDPDSIRLTLGMSPSITLVWDDAPDWDDDFKDDHYEKHSLVRTVSAESFSASHSGYTNITWVQSSGNASQAKLDLHASGGWKPGDSDY